MKDQYVREIDGQKFIDIHRVTGKGYERAWFTNCKDARYRLLVGARNTKKSVNMIGFESVTKIISNPLINVLTYVLHH